MQHYASPTPKRHYGYSNSPVAMRLDKGKLLQDQRKPKHERIATADIYFDKKGHKKYKGNRNLSATENLDFAIKSFDQLPGSFPLHFVCARNLPFIFFVETAKDLSLAIC